MQALLADNFWENCGHFRVNNKFLVVHTQRVHKLSCQSTIDLFLLENIQWIEENHRFICFQSIWFCRQFHVLKICLRTKINFFCVCSQPLANISYYKMYCIYKIQPTAAGDTHSLPPMPHPLQNSKEPPGGPKCSTTLVRGSTLGNLSWSWSLGWAWQCCLNKCHSDSRHLLNMVPETYQSLVKIRSVTGEIFLIWTNVTRTNVAWTNVTMAVGNYHRWSQEPTFKVWSKSGQ